MPRKSAKMIRTGHFVTTINGHETKVTGVTRIETVNGELIVIELANGETWRRTPGAKINVTRTR